jgi:replicative DNA helicase
LAIIRKNAREGTQLNEGVFLDRIPPQNLEAEQAVLGAILLDSDSLVTAVERVNSDDFYRTSHQRIFESMLELADENEPIDLITLTSKMQNKQQLEEIGGIKYLSELASAVPTAANCRREIDAAALDSRGDEHCHRRLCQHG